MIKQGILIVGVVFYAFVITNIVGDIRDENFSKSFLRIIDNDDDGIITSKELKAFEPCPNYDGKELNRQFAEYGRKADLNELSEFLDPKLILKMVKPCIGNTIGKASDPEHLRHLSKTEIQKELLEAYDLDNDNEVRWAEYQIANQFLPKVPKNLREIFRFFDKNHNWVIEHKEIQKSKPKQLVDFLGSGKRK